MGAIKDILKNNIRQYAMLIALILIMALFQFLTDGILLKPQNVTNLILQNSYVIILAVGMVLCIISSANIDLSVGSLVALVGAIVGTLIVVMKVNIGLAIIAGLAVGIIIGIWQGFWIAYMKIPAFIVTLAGMLLFRGLTLVILQGKTISPFPEKFLTISSGFVHDYLSFLQFTHHKLNITALAVGALISIIYIIVEFRSRSNKKKYEFEVIPFPMFIIKILIALVAVNIVSYWLASYKGIPVVLILLAGLILLFSFLMSKTVFGRYIYAMGGNEKAAKLSGINTNKVLFLIYVNMGLLSAVTGIVFTARLMAATPTAGNNFELDAIAACFIGGASATGGIGTVVGAIIGALVMGVLNNGMSILGVGSDWQMTIKGFVLLLAVAFDVFSKMRARA